MTFFSTFMHGFINFLNFDLQILIIFTKNFNFHDVKVPLPGKKQLQKKKKKQVVGSYV